MSVADPVEAIKEFIETCGPIFEKLEKTILLGWPFDEYPTEDEAKMIIETMHELGMHEPSLSESRRWYIAGQIVARFRRMRSQELHGL